MNPFFERAPQTARDDEAALLQAMNAADLEIEWHETPQLWRKLIEQADVCLEYARLAEKGLRFSAACGLILTANELLRRALCVECNSTTHLVLERAVIERLDASRRDLERLLELAVQVRMFGIAQA